MAKIWKAINEETEFFKVDTSSFDDNRDDKDIIKEFVLEAHRSEMHPVNSSDLLMELWKNNKLKITKKVNSPFGYCIVEIQ